MYIFIITSADWHGGIGQRANRVQQVTRWRRQLTFVPARVMRARAWRHVQRSELVV